VSAANKMIELLAHPTGASQADFSRDYDVLDPQILSRYDATIMNSTAHLAIPDDGKEGGAARLCQEGSRRGGDPRRHRHV
jgi:hypothetical protein